MGKPSRDKGARGERELVSLLPGATKISAMYKSGPDLIWRNRTIEVKRRREGFKFDYRHLQDAQILAKRSDRNEWLLTMTLDTLLDLLATCKHGYINRHVVVHSPSNPQYCEGGTDG